MTTYFKAVDTNGKDFWSGTIDYGKAAKSRSKKIEHPTPLPGSINAGKYFSVATVATDCTGFRWPARLFEVEPIGDVWTPHADNMPNKRAAVGLTIIRELDAHLLFGPEGERIVALIAVFDSLTSLQREALYQARIAATDFWETYDKVAYAGRADRAGLRAARDALDDRLRGWDDGDAAYGAALALLIRPYIGRGRNQFRQKEYDILSGPWRKTIGPIHPDDKPVK